MSGARMRLPRLAALLVGVALLLGSCAPGRPGGGDRADGDAGAVAALPSYQALAALSECRLLAEAGYRVALDRDAGVDGAEILKRLALQPATPAVNRIMRIVRFAHTNPDLTREDVRAAVLAECRRVYGLPDGL